MTIPHTDTLTDAPKTARAAAEYRANIGERPSMLDALDPEYLETDEPAEGEAKRYWPVGVETMTTAEVQALNQWAFDYFNG